MGNDCDDNGTGTKMSMRMHPSILQVIVGAIVVVLLIMLFIWLLPIIGFLVVVGLVVLLIVAAVIGLIWLINGLRRGITIGKSSRKTKSMAAEE